MPLKNRQKMKGSLAFSGDVEMELWAKMAEHAVKKYSKSTVTTNTPDSCQEGSSIY